MNKEIKKLFRNFEENCGWKSIIKFMEYVDMYESKKNYKLILKLKLEFDDLESFGLVKNYVNFRRYCLSK